MANFRTPEELSNPSFNYFIAFKIDLKETNVKNIEDTIKKALSSTAGGLQSRRLLELKDDILEIMVNDSVYEAQSGTYKKGAGGRKKESDQAKKFKLQEAVDLVKIICKSRTTILKSELVDICKDMNKSAECFTEKEFFDQLSYLSKQGINIIDNIDAKIPFIDYEKTDGLLETKKACDLYEFLSTADANTPITRASGDAEIKKASDAIFARDQKKSNLSEKQGTSALCGYVKKFLLSGPEAKKNYNYYVDLKADVWSELATKKKFGSKDMTMDQYIEYAQKIVDILKISTQEAQTLLAIGCKYYQQTLTTGSKTPDQLQECPYDDCAKLFQKGVKVCPHCGRALETACWNCSGKTPVTKEDPGCVNCGATRQAQKLFDTKCNDIKSLLLKPVVDINLLKNKLLEAKSVVPNYEKNTASTVYKKIQELNKSVQEKVAQEETTGKNYRDDETKIRKLIVEKKYQTAFTIAKSLKTKYSTYNVSNTETIINELNQYLAKTESVMKYARASMAQGNANGAVSYAIKALETCQDCQEATTILQKYPPAPVTNVRAVYNGGKVKIEWDDNSKQEFVTYTIIKKIGAQPANAEDGAIVEKELSMKYYEDASIVSATPYYYAVYVERCGIKSRISVIATPIMVFLDVANVQQDFLTGGVKAVWEAPQNVKSIEVWKNVGPVAPLRAGEGTKVPCDAKGFEDKCQGQNSYLIICNYQTNAGLRQSKGIRVVYKPFEKIEPLQNTLLTTSDDGNRYIFSCKAGYVGKISLYYANAKIPVQTNATLRYLEFSTLCKGLIKISTTVNAEGNLTFTLPKNGIYQIYPIVATEQLFVVSPPHLVNTMLGIEGHTINVSSGTVTVSGSIQPKAKNVIACVSNTKHVQTINDGAEKYIFSKDDFAKKGKIDLKLKAETISYISIFVEFVDDGVKSYSQPIFIDPVDYRDEVMVLFTIDYELSHTKPFKVTINMQCDKEVEVPALVLMKGNPEPLNKAAGELCERLDPITLKKGLFSKVYTGKHIIKLDPIADKRTKFAVFLSSESTFVKIRKVRKL